MHKIIIMTLTAELKERTAREHQQSEKELLSMLKSIRTKEDYISLLNCLYGIYAPIEALIRPFLTADKFPDMVKRSRAHLLGIDMQSHVLFLPPPETCELLPRIDSFARALGALYVLEGSTMGGRHIAAMMTKTLGFQKGLLFFNSYGAETDRMWQSFKDFLDSQVFTPEEGQEVVAAAEETFITFKICIGKHELHPQL